MTPNQFQTLLSVINGEKLTPLPTAFIIDHPWLPKWAGVTIKEYFDDEEKWLEANFKAFNSFPDTIFIPGFWSEYGMCTEPSAFGSECIWHENDSPFAEKVITDISQVNELRQPDPEKDGLLPQVIQRLKNCQARIQDQGHEIKFAVARGPLNIASFLMGSTEFLMALPMNPEESHQLLEIITRFTEDWLKIQAAAFPSIEGILILDDIVGFIGVQDFKTFAQPCLTRIFSAFDAGVKLFHNDPRGIECAPFLEEIGIDIFNFSGDHPISQMQELTKNRVTLLGNIPPRDVLAKGTPVQVEKTAKEMLASLSDTTRIIPSAGGGMPPDVSTQNIEAFFRACRSGVSNYKAQA